MISRRNFIKLAGLSTLAVGAGYTTGKLTDNSKSVYYSIHGFIPGDEHIIHQIVSAFKQKIKSKSEPIVCADPKLAEVITRLDLYHRDDNYSSNGTINYSLTKLHQMVDADLIVGDENRSIYSLDDLDITLANLRRKLKGLRASYTFTAAYNETSFLSSLFKQSNEIVIENEKGLADKFSSQKNYKSIAIDGPQGKTIIEIIDGIARVTKSTCRHQICKQTFANKAGSFIACAPNKVLVKIA